MADSPDEKLEREERLVEATVTALEAAGGRMNIVLLMKALFYADLAALRDTRHTVTRQPYLALEFGPVVAKYDKRVIAALERRGLAASDQEGDSKPLSLT